jgi:hypothetical protein
LEHRNISCVVPPPTTAGMLHARSSALSQCIEIPMALFMSASLLEIQHIRVTQKRV